jgi:hypothetical protein
MALKERLRHSKTVSIIPRSGIQFLDFRLKSDSDKLPKDWGCHDSVTKGELPKPGEFAIVTRDDEAIGGQTKGIAAKYSVGKREIFELFADRWTPLPLLRRVGDGFYRGPSNWARIKIAPLAEPDDEGSDFHIVLALDTDLMDHVDGRPYLAPAPSDAEAGLPFGLANDAASVGWFLAEEWVVLWINELYREMLEARRQKRQHRRRADPITQEEIDEELEATGYGEPLLRYAALLDMLDRAEVLPENIKLVDTLTSRRQPYIDCDLVLDVGNSRTCGLIVERDPDHGADVAQAVKLELRDLGSPEHVYSDPFESRVEFALASFGRNHLSHRSGRADAFEWPTLTRVGDEAARLAGQRVGNEGSTGMSSPKRYLWSEDSPAQPWRFNHRTLRGDIEPLAAQGPLAVLVNDLGTPLHLVGEDGDFLPAMEARYSRSNLFTFALTEIFLQALTMINSAAHRSRRPNGDNPRRLKRIIMTMPSALPLAERRILADRAKAARDLVYLALKLAKSDGPGALDWDTDGAVEPEILLVWDEASATQVVYLYTQIVKNFSGHAPAFFETMRRAENMDAKGLRVATLDIGGGTTDLVITEFTHEGTGNAVTIFPEQLFREGFNVAGDDLVYRVVQAHVLDRIEKAVEEAGVSNGRALTVDLFGGDRGDMDVSDQVRRQQFALQVAAPIALQLLSRYEAGREAGSDATSVLSFDDIFRNGNRPSDDIITHLNTEVERRGGSGFDLREVTFPVDLDALEQTARSVLQPILDVMAEIVWRYGCDLLLVSGRPSRLPMVKASLEEALPMLVGRVVPLHRFRVGNWYPFRDHEARIDDPKTTAAVGAMICALAEGGIESFNFRSDRIRNPKSTARYIGKIDGAGRIPEEDTYYAGIDLESEDQDMPEGGFEFRGVMALGFRQFPNEWWPATRLYTLDYRSEDDRRRLHAKTPIEVTLKRGRAARGDQLTEAMLIDEARDVDGRSAKAALELKLQTLSDGDGYWLDTGILRRS